MYVFAYNSGVMGNGQTSCGSGAAPSLVGASYIISLYLYELNSQEKANIYI